MVDLGSKVSRPSMLFVPSTPEVMCLCLCRLQFSVKIF